HRRIAHATWLPRRIVRGKNDGAEYGRICDGFPAGTHDGIEHAPAQRRGRAIIEALLGLIEGSCRYDDAGSELVVMPEVGCCRDRLDVTPVLGPAFARPGGHDPETVILRQSFSKDRERVGLEAGPGIEECNAGRGTISIHHPFRRGDFRTVPGAV